MSRRTIDFSNVKEASTYAPRRLPEGTYKALITKVDEATSKAGNPMWVYAISPVEHPTAVYPYYLLLEEKHLWKLRSLLLAAGRDVPRRRVTVDPESIVGEEIMIDLTDDEWEGREKSVIAGVFKCEEDPQPALVTDEEIDFDVDEI